MRIFFLVACSASFFFSVVVLADEQTSRQIYVTGEAKATLDPDYAEWVLDIKTVDKHPRLALDVNDTLIESIKEIAKKSDIDEEDLVTGLPMIERVESERSRLLAEDNYVHTEVRRVVTLRLRDLEEFKELLDAVHNLGVNYSIAYRSSRFDEVWAGVKEAAIKDAKAKAIKQAGVLGQEIGSMVSLAVSPHWILYGQGLFGSPDEDEQVDQVAGADGKIHLTAYADVTFELKP